MKWNYCKFFNSLKNKEWIKDKGSDKYYHISGDYYIYGDTISYIWQVNKSLDVYKFNVFEWTLNILLINIFGILK